MSHSPDTGPAPDQTLLLGPDDPPSLASRQSRSLRLTLVMADGEIRTLRTRHRIVVGSHPSCDLVVSDVGVSKRHAELYPEEGRWWVRDLGSTNGTWFEGRSIERELVEDQSILRLVPKGRPITCDFVDGDSSASPLLQTHDGVSVTDIYEQIFQPDTRRMLSAKEERLRAAAERAWAGTRRNTRQLIIGLVAVLLLTLTVVVVQQRRLAALSDLAVGVFYDMKQLEVRIAGSDSPELRRQLDHLETRYDRMLIELGLADSERSPQERQILAMARIFGECEVNAPDDFVSTVQTYIERWRRGARLEKAVGRLTDTGQVETLSQLLLDSGLPPQFLYLAIQESDFVLEAVGPPTRFGIAKGPWQFLPVTAREMGLETGPLVEVRAFDPLDERFDLHKATHAAGRYLRDLYDTDAQHSGLLVMASYNWGQGNLRRRIRELPASPRERNFWKLLQSTDVPQETLDYVFGTLSAAVIGDNPALFDFDFPPPLPKTIERPQSTQTPNSHPPTPQPQPTTR